MKKLLTIVALIALTTVAFANNSKNFIVINANPLFKNLNKNSYMHYKKVWLEPLEGITGAISINANNPYAIFNNSGESKIGLIFQTTHMLDATGNEIYIAVGQSCQQLKNGFDVNKNRNIEISKVESQGPLFKYTMECKIVR